jgi:hypothetical protein
MARKRRSNDLARARAEAAALLRLDPSRLSPADVLRCDIVASLRLVIDTAHADVLDGTSTDLGKLMVAVETLTKLLPAVDVRMGTTTVSPATVRAKLLQLVLDARAADQVEGDQVEASALQEAERRIQQLEDENLHLRGVRPRQLPPPTDKPLKKRPGCDRWPACGCGTQSGPHTCEGVDQSTDAQAKSTTKLAANPAKPPPGYDPIVNGLWREPVAAPAAPAAPVVPSPSPTPPSARPSEPAWRSWYYSGGGYSSDVPTQGWIDRLNAKSW